MKDYIKLQEKARAKAFRQEKGQWRKTLRQNKAYLKGLLDELALKGAKTEIETFLELERDEFLDRASHERVASEEFRGYRNGYSPRTVGLGCGQVEIKMPRVSNSQKRFESKILPPYIRTSPAILETLPQLYLYGLSSGDFREALKVLLGEKAVLSASSIIRLQEHWQKEYFSFHQQPLDSHYAYIFADGIYLRVGLAKENLAVLVVIGVAGDGNKRLLAMIPGYRESYENWLDVFRNLRERGVEWVGLVVADGILGLWRAVKEVFPETLSQRDWVHKIRNVLNKLPRDKGLQKRAHRDLLEIYHASTRRAANEGFLRFARPYQAYPTAVECLLKDRETLITYFNFPKEHWQHIKTTNPIESPFATIRVRLKKAKRIINENSALGVVFHLMLKRQSRWRRLKYPELAAAVVAGKKFRDGVEVR